MTSNQVSDVIVDAIVDALKQELQINTDKTDPSYVAHIQGGKLQADPIQKGDSWGHSIEVHIGDPDTIEFTWVDELAGPDDEYIKFYSLNSGRLPIMEVGGTNFSGMFWWRRGVVRINSFFILPAYERDEARQVHNLLRRKVEQVLGGGSFVGLKDDDNREQVIFFMPVKSSAKESGGPSNQFIWRGRIWWQALVSRT